MDRRTFAVCAITLVSLSFVVSDRRGTQNVSSLPTLAHAPLRTSGDLGAATTIPPEPHCDARVILVVAIAEETETSSSDEVDNSPLRVGNAAPKSQLRFGASEIVRKSKRATRVLKADTGVRAETDLRLLVRGTSSAIESSPASKILIGGYDGLTNNEFALADNGAQCDPSDRTAADCDPPQNPLRMNGSASFPLVIRELPKQGVAKHVIDKRDVLLGEQSPALGLRSSGDFTTDQGRRFVVLNTEPTSAASPVPDMPVRADNVSISDHATPDDEPSDRCTLNNEAAAPRHPEHNLQKQDSPQQVTTKPDVPKHDPSGDEQRIVSSTSPEPIDFAPAANSEVPRTELPWAKAVRHAPEMIAVIERADQQVRHGFQLAERGALYLARAEFVAALKLIAQANDIQQSTRIYSKAASAGLLALKESSDFVRQPMGIKDIDVAKMVSGHKTPVLKNSDVSELAPIIAAQRYYAYAQEQLAAAAAQEMAGSMALYGLGKVAIRAMDNKSQELEYTGQAMTLFQAALIAEPNNFRAANELGVLWAENGQLRRARELFILSVSLSPQPATWHNLAIVHARLGEEALAERARVESRAMQNPSSEITEQAVQWVEPATFARMMSATDGAVPAATLTKTEPTSVKSEAEPAKPSSDATKKGIKDWLPWNRRH